MRYAFVRPRFYHEWGGDLKAIQDLGEGLRLLGHDSFVTTDVVKACDSDVICFLGTISDYTSAWHFMRLIQRDYGCIAFHEDELLFVGASFGFFHYVAESLQKSVTTNGHVFSIEQLIERPHLIFYFDQMKTFHGLINYEFLKEARFLIANSPTEERTLLRDAPGCKTHVVFWGPGFAGNIKKSPEDSFLRFTGLSRGSYILQVGRINLRKNQLATLLATRDLDIPLVFIAMGKRPELYEHAFFATVSQKRKAPVILISQDRKIFGIENLKMIPTPNYEILSEDLLLSAFANAGLYLHPAFYELPGYTYLEAARFGIPTIASEWGSLRDYFVNSEGQYTLDDRIEYVLPYDIGAIKKLVEKKFGQKYSETPLHPIFHRTPEHIAQDFLKNTISFF